MSNFRELIFKSIFITILLISFPIFAVPNEILEKKHLEFYQAGESKI